MTALQEAALGAPDAPARRVSPVDRARALSGDLARPLLLYAASRLLVLAAAFTGAVLLGTGPGSREGHWPDAGSTGSATLDGLLRWDSAWNLRVAELGYSEEPSSTRNAFFPLLPVLVRGYVGATGADPTTAGLVLAHVAGALATVAVWLLGRRLAGRAAADRMAALFAFFPGAFVLSMVYAEGLLVALAAGALAALDRRRWLLAGVLGALATAARPNGVAVLAACAWAALAVVARPGDEGRREWRALLAPAVAGLGIAAFFAYLARLTGEPLAWFASQREGWREDVGIAAQLERITAVIADPQQPAGYLNTWLPLIGLVVMAVAVVALLRWRPSGPVVVYALVAIAMVLTAASVGARPRMLLGAFPLVMALAYATRGPAFTGLLGVFAGGTALLTVITVSSIWATP